MKIREKPMLTVYKSMEVKEHYEIIPVLFWSIKTLVKTESFKRTTRIVIDMDIEDNEVDKLEVILNNKKYKLIK